MDLFMNKGFTLIIPVILVALAVAVGIVIISTTTSFGRKLI